MVGMGSVCWVGVLGYVIHIAPPLMQGAPSPLHWSAHIDVVQYCLSGTPLPPFDKISLLQSAWIGNIPDDPQ